MSASCASLVWRISGKEPSLPWKRKDVRNGALALLAVLVLKLSVGLPLSHHPLLVPEGELDGAWYRHFAERILAGDVWLAQPESFFGQAPAPFFISPLYIYALALFLKIGGSLAGARVIQLILGTIGVGLIGLTARRWYGPRAMWVAGALAAGCGLFTFYETLILQAALDPVLTALDLYTLTRALQDGRRRDWVVAGAALGLHALNRPNMLIVIAGLALAVMTRLVLPALKGRPTYGGRGFSSAALLASAAMVIAPVTIRNFRVSGELIPISSHGGLNFYIGNGPEANGTFVSAMGVEPSIRGQWIDAPRVASAAAGRALSVSETSELFRRRALDWIGAHPGAEVALLARKTWYALSGSFLPLNYSFPFYAQDTGSALRFLAAGPWILLPLGLVGLTIARPRREGFLIWASYIPLAIVSVVIFFVAARYRLPFQIALTVAAGGGLAWLIDRARERAWAALVPAVVLGSVGLAVSLWPTGLDDGRAEEGVRMGLYELERGAVTEGESWIDRALPQHGFPGVVHLRAGQLHESKGRLDDALRHYRAGIVIDSGEASLHIAAARVLTQQKRPVDAVAELDQTKAGAMDDAAAREYERAGLTFTLSGQPAEAIDAFAKAAARDPEVPSAHLNRAVALAMLGRLAEARTEAEAALKIDQNYEKAKEFLKQIK